MKHVRLISHAVMVFSGLLLGWMVMIPVAGAGEKPPVPDFTQGGKKDDTHDWTLGPTGARGWVFGWKGQTADACYKPFAILDGGRWMLWYNGRRGDAEQIGLAVHEGEGLGF
jgi:hypothetical protein